MHCANNIPAPSSTHSRPLQVFSLWWQPSRVHAHSGLQCQTPEWAPETKNAL